MFWIRENYIVKKRKEKNMTPNLTGLLCLWEIHRLFLAGVLAGFPFQSRAPVSLPLIGCQRFREGRRQRLDWEDR